MYKRIVTLVVSILYLFNMQALATDQDIRAFRQQQREKRQEFHKEQRQEREGIRKDIEKMTPEERQMAMEQDWKTITAKRQEFLSKLHQENVVFLKERLAQNSKLTEQEKGELISFLEQQHDNVTDFRQKNQQETIDFFQKTANDTSLTQEQKKQAIKDFISAREEERRQFIRQQHAAQQAEMEKLISHMKQQRMKNETLGGKGKTGQPR